MFSSLVAICFETVLPFSSSSGGVEELLTEAETSHYSSYGLTKYKVLSNMKYSEKSSP